MKILVRKRSIRVILSCTIVRAWSFIENDYMNFPFSKDLITLFVQESYSNVLSHCRCVGKRFI